MTGSDDWTWRSAFERRSAGLESRRRRLYPRRMPEATLKYVTIPERKAREAARAAAASAVIEDKAMPTVTAARVIIDRLLDEIDEFRTPIDGN